MAAESPSIITEVDNSIAVVRLNRPTQRNSLSLATLQDLDTTLSILLARPELSALIVTGTGDVFAAGADIRELAELTPSAAIEFAKRGQELFQKIADARQITVAAINGYCFGGGLDLALACDIRVASQSAVFSHPGARRGIITGWGGTQRLPRLIGKRHALDMFVTARQVSSEEALQFGLVSRVFDPVLTCALELASIKQNGAEPKSGASFSVKAGTS